MPHIATQSRGLLLSQVISSGHWYGGDEIRIASCCVEPDRCQPGDLFVVLEDSPLDAQQAVDTAVSRGASAILGERIFPRPVRQYLVDDCRAAYGQLCHALVGDPARSLRTVGITGSHGKTVTEQLLLGVFQAAGYQAAALGSPSADGVGEAKLTASSAPAAARLARWLAEFRGQGGTHAVIEASSQALAERQFSGLSLDAAVITHIGREHIRWHGSLPEYQAAKAHLLQQLKPGGFAVLNADDPASVALHSQIDAPAITVGLQQPADITATLIERHVSEQTFLLEAGDESHVVRTQMIGDAHLYNCLAAAAVGLVMGIRPSHIVRGLESVTSLPARLQRLECGQPFAVFIDRSYSPRSLAQLLTTLRQVCTRRLYCVLGIDQRQSATGRAQLGRVLERMADHSVLTSSRLNRKLSLKTAHEVLDGFDRPAQAHLMPHRSRAICWTLSQAKAGDVVLVAAGRPCPVADDTLLDEDLARYWLQHVDPQTPCPWTPA